jgi:hypothetical protein
MPQVTFLVSVLVSSVALATPTVEQCVAASTSAQKEQRAGAYLAARRQLELCASPQCPTVIQSDCTKWLAEVLAATPSLVVVARVDGVDQQQARVLLDGHLWLGELSGHPEEVEPGQHELTVSVGTQTRFQKLLVNVGEKNRLIVFEFSTATVEAPVEPAPVVERGAPVVHIVLSALAVAGGVTFGVLGLSGRASLDALLKQECAATKTCRPALVTEIQRRFLAADIALGVGVVSAGLDVWRWVAWASTPVAVAFDGQRLVVAGEF